MWRNHLEDNQKNDCQLLRRSAHNIFLHLYLLLLLLIDELERWIKYACDIVSYYIQELNGIEKFISIKSILYEFKFMLNTFRCSFNHLPCACENVCLCTVCCVVSYIYYYMKERKQCSLYIYWKFVCGKALFFFLKEKRGRKDYNKWRWWL